MSFLRKWLRLERTERISLHPAKTLELAMPYDTAFDRCVAGIEGQLGGVVRTADRARGRIEATFGLMFSERLTCTLERIDERRTRAIVESRTGAQAQATLRSDYVETLAAFLGPPDERGTL